MEFLPWEKLVQPKQEQTDHFRQLCDKSTTPISEGLKEKKLKATNAETALVRLLGLLP